MEDGYYLLSEECAALIEKGLYYSELSGGAFDITIEPVSSLWDFTSGEKIVPDAETIAEKQACVGYEDVELKGNKLRFKKEGMGIELGAVAKGYIADKLKEYLIQHKVNNALINLGGNILCIGDKMTEGYRIGITNPQKTQLSILEEMCYVSEKNRMGSRLKSESRSRLPIGAKQCQP